MKEYTIQTDQRELQSLLSSREHNANQVGDVFSVKITSRPGNKNQNADRWFGQLNPLLRKGRHKGTTNS
jgi:hypothetical protein